MSLISVSIQITTMLLQIPGPAPDLILISLFFLGLLYFLVWRLDRRPQVFGIESSRSRRPRFIASGIITAIFLVSLVHLLSQSDRERDHWQVYVRPYLAWCND
ncbi:MAG: hypothetical protein ACTSV2_02085 [Candidatus Thorarchaeota archaeon]